ncbi:hypothetical protein H310_06750 [Aphanomyces invadans]|uniref:Uncharacterized protein n=1 Tax=Aphanomyces invadans TaxID=157072 RepID=A0A024U4G5_9STRA|nr:hypothetical protein H310_06750 [Aphanomyces invadans]ETW01144.1 hypothetical protein H310_06750 [Aphanomyces invadans]|eukprot:XP_008870142.1 hypothetical protein H310_06750 [Aphanomyces invadans]
MATLTRKLFRQKSTRIDMKFLDEEQPPARRKVSDASRASQQAPEPVEPPAPTKRPTSIVLSSTEPLLRDAAKAKSKPPLKESPHIRLYALGVHLLDHKDQVHNLFSHYTTDKKLDSRRRSRQSPRTSASSSCSSTNRNASVKRSLHGKSMSYDATDFRQFAQSQTKPTSVRTTIKHLRRKFMAHDQNDFAPLVEVSRKTATPIDKHNTVRPGVSPIRAHKSPTRLHVEVVPRRPSLYAPDIGDDDEMTPRLSGDRDVPETTTMQPTSKDRTSSPREKRSPGKSDVDAVAADIVAAAEKAKVLQLTEQINMLKSTLGLTDEDLQWKVESAKSNAFMLADKHLATAEEEYDRLLYEQSLWISCPFEDCTKELAPLLKALSAQAKEAAETKAVMLVAQQEVNSTKKSLLDARVDAEMKRARSNSPPRRESVLTRDCVDYQTALGDQKKELLVLQEKFKAGVLKQDALQKQVVAATEAMVASFGAQAVSFSTIEMADNARELMELVHSLGQTSGEDLVGLCTKATAVCKLFHGYQAKELSRKEREINATLKQMEIWRTRREQSKEYAVEMRRMEVEWKAQHAAENQTCYERLCSLIPDTITSMSVEQLLDAAKAAGVLYTRDLANYLKQNKFLQWIVTHERDKSRDNFLTGDTAQCFANFEAFDVTEMRGLFVALPDMFEFDKDGRKAEWRSAFVAHLKMLVQQQRGECVKAGWDPVKGARAEVKLKPPTEKQLLNPMYRYPTEVEIKQRLERFETQAKRLAQKKARMQVLITQDIPMAKKEYHAVAEDARSEDLLRQFGKPALIKLRDESKKVYQSLCKECDTLKGEVAVGERAAQIACPTYEQYVDEIAAIRQLAPEVRAGVINGPFDAHPVVKPKERAVHKKLSAEEEAVARKHELSHAIAERTREFHDLNKNTDDESTPPALTDATTPDDGAPVASRKMSLSEAPMLTAAQTVVTLSKTIRAVKASPAVLSFLQNDFCNKQRRRPSTTSPVKPTTSLPKMGVILDGDEMQDEGPAPPPDAAAMPKSHALMKLMGMATKPVLAKRPSMLHDPNLLEDLSKPNMMAEIQRRRSSKGTPPASPMGKKPGVNFLEELKRRAEGKNPGMEDKVEAGAPTPQPSVAVPTKPMSFLDELKMKSKAKD